MLLLAPYRALVVAIGSGIAFFWTIFPYPITERHVMRQETAAALDDLIVYHDCCQAAIRLKLRGVDKDHGNEQEESRQLHKLQAHAFDSLQRLIMSLRTRLQFQKYELSVGGRFPSERYAAILGRITSLFEYATQMAHAANGVEENSLARLHEASEAWSQEVEMIIEKLNDGARQISFCLTLLSGCIKHAVPLPPVPKVYAPFEHADILVRLDQEYREDGQLHFGNAYSTFAIFKLMSELTCKELDGLVGDVKALVGEVDYSICSPKFNHAG